MPAARPISSWSTRGTAVGGEGRTLYIGRGDAIVSIDTDTMRVSAPWSLGGTLAGLTLSPDGRRLYAAVPGRIEQLEPSTGAVQASISAPGLTGIAAIEAIGP
jgi:DNA-binding beta-propeller fold protein YncE